MSDCESCSDRRTAFGRFVFNHDRQVLTRDFHELALPAASLLLLAGLLDRAGTTVPHHALAIGGAVGSGRAASEATRTAMRQLRQALRDPADYPMFIETVRGVGYRFIAPVQRGSPGVVTTHRTLADDLRFVANIDTQTVNTLPAAPERNLLQWLADDASSVDFAIVWTIATVPFSMMSDGLGLVALMFVPPIIRLGQRAAVFRRLLRAGVPVTDIRRAFDWANDGDPAPPLSAGWRHLLAKTRRTTGWMFIAATIILLMSMQLSPWNFSKSAQLAFDAFFHSYNILAKLTLGVFVLDAALRPRPVWQRFRRHARRGWRNLLTRFIPEIPAEQDRHRKAADLEIELLLSE
ncbi:MAG: helix-turn-helix domain-containing protein [Gemmatimonadaceae bacterium]